jgi:esterase/lipase
MEQELKNLINDIADIESELSITNDSKNLIVSFGGMALKMSDQHPFEFLRFLSNTFNNKVDLMFYVDKNMCWYHKGISGITKNIEQTSEYLQEKIKDYENVIFLGVSSGGYASILFSSLCNVKHSISFIPQTILKIPVEPKYRDLKPFINDTTNYIIYGDNKNKDFLHNISHCENLDDFENVTIVKHNKFDIKMIRDNGDLKKLLSSLLI